MNTSDEQTSPPSLISKILIFEVLHKRIATIVTLKKNSRLKRAQMQRIMLTHTCKSH